MYWPPSMHPKSNFAPAFAPFLPFPFRRQYCTFRRGGFGRRVRPSSKNVNKIIEDGRSRPPKVGNLTFLTQNVYKRFTETFERLPEDGGWRYEILNPPLADYSGSGDRRLQPPPQQALRPRTTILDHLKYKPSTSQSRGFLPKLQPVTVDLHVESFCQANRWTDSHCAKQ